MRNSISIVLTGGGTGGHVIPCLAIAREIKKLQPRVAFTYLGGSNSIEERLACAAHIPFKQIAVGKLRRYFDLQNLVDLFRIPLGILQSIHHLHTLRPQVVFAKGGFVSVPVAIAAYFLRIPLIIHESDATPGLATRIMTPLATKVCTSFLSPTPSPTTIHTGNPVRPVGNAARGTRFLNFKNNLPIVLIVGGSTGAKRINELAGDAIQEITPYANVVLITGKNKSNQKSKIKNKKLRVFEFLGPEYLDVLAAANLVISRAGSGALAEIAGAGTPAILIPLSTVGSRGDQLANAKIFSQQKAAIVCEETILTPKKLSELTKKTLNNTKQMQSLSVNIQKLAKPDAAKLIAKLILETIQQQLV